MGDKLKKTLSRAEKAYQKRDRRAAARLVDEILQQDFNHPGTWDLLYLVYGHGQEFQAFQRAFAEKFYPDKVHLLQDTPTRSSTAAGDTENEPPRRPSFLARLFVRFRRARPVEPAEVQLPPASPSSAPIAAAPSESRDTPRPAPASPGVTLAPMPQTPTTPSWALKRQDGSQAAPAPAAGDGRTIRVVVVDDIAETRENVIRSLSFQTNVEVIGFAANGANGVKLVKETDPDVVLMDVNMPDMDGITATAYIRREAPLAQVIILTVQDDVDYMRKAMHAGARDFLTKPPTIDELSQAVQKAGEIAHRERAKVAEPVMIAANGSAAVMTGRGKIITVYSPKGGTGCTTLAANLAVTLQNPDTPVALIDGNLQFGDVTVLFNEQGKNTVLDLALRADELDPEIVDSVMIRHKSGIKLLAAPRPRDAEQISGEQFGQMLHYLTRIFSYVVVDTAHELNDVTFAALEASDLIVLVATQEVPCIANLRKFLELAPLIHLKPERMALALNQYDKRLNITPEKISQYFKLPVSAVVPKELQASLAAANHGEPYMLQGDSAGQPLGKGLLGLSEAVLKRLAQAEENRK